MTLQNVKNIKGTTDKNGLKSLHVNKALLESCLQNIGNHSFSLKSSIVVSNKIRSGDNIFLVAVSFETFLKVAYSMVPVHKKLLWTHGDLIRGFNPWLISSASPTSRRLFNLTKYFVLVTLN